jgi:PAS domain S-box-containing protein
MMERTGTMDDLRRAALGLAVLIALYVVGIHDYLFFHTVAEGFSIVVACAIFLIAWNSRRFLDNNYLLFLGVAYLFVAGFDALHALAYKGMNIFHGNDPNLPTQLWIVGRYLQSISLLVAPFFLGRKFPIAAVFSAYCLISVLILGSLFVVNIFPDCYVQGSGLTRFKIYSEYIICAILLASIYTLNKHRNDFDGTVLSYLIWSMFTLIVSELFFTNYVSVYGVSNFVGHFFKIISFYLLYKALVERALTDPYEVLFRDLDRKREELQRERNFVSAVLDTAGSLVLVLDAEGRIVRFNRACEQITGYAFGEVQGAPFWDLFVVPEEVEQAKAIFWERASVESPNNYENYWIAKDGGRRLISWSNTALLDETGHVEHVITTGVDITEQRRAEQETLRAKEEWETTFDAVPDLIMILDEGHRILRANKAMADTLGIRPGDMTGKTCYELVHGIEAPPKFCAHTRAMLDGREHQKEVYEDRLNGVFSVSCSPLRDRGGRLIGSVHVAHNITDRKRSEEKLASTVSELQKANAETNALLVSARALLEHRDFQESAQIIFQQCRQLVGATAGYIGLLDRTEQVNEMLFLHSGMLVCNVDSSLPMPIRGFREEVYRTRMTAYENSFENSKWVNLLPAGHVTLENVMFAPLILAGKAVGLLGLANKPGGFTDEDARLCAAFAEFAALGLLNSRTLESLEHSEERFRSVFQTANDAIICVDNSGKVVLWNSGAEQIFGYSAEEATGNSLDLVVPAKFSQTHAKSVERVLSQSTPNCSLGVRVVVASRKDSTEFPAELSVASWETKEGGFLTGIVRDITQRKRAEEALQRTLTELERSNSELQQFAYVASHDLQEPLRMVSSYMQLLERRYKGKLDSDADDFITYAVDGAKRMRRLINDLLQYSRVGTHGKPFEPIDCAVVLDQALGNLKLAVEDTNARVTHDPLPTVMADGTQITQLFQNLIDNALKFRKNESPLVHVSAQPNEDHWLFSVHDNGIEIDPEYSERIFIIFQRLHGREEYPGTGIGLAICKKIVSRHGGRIWVESGSEQGTTFFFTIPHNRG